ncbi:MAG: hypothetical protein ABR985_13880 [Methanotrichaceae archaeon]
MRILLNPQRLGIRTETEARAQKGEIPKFAKYACILKNSMASKETANERISLMKDRAAVDERR